MFGIEDKFCDGAIAGAIIIGVFGYILNNIRFSRARSRERNKPFDRFPDANHPDLTSSIVVRRSCLAMLKFVLWSLLMIVFIYLVYSFLSTLGFGI